MRAVWIDAGNDPDYARLAEHGITAPYFDHRDPRVTADYLDAVKARGLTPGIYSAWNWYPLLTGSQYAVKVDAELRRIGWLGNPPVCLDIETHHIAGYVVPCLRRWRQLRPRRQTDWTLEGGQGGLFAPIDVAGISATNVRVVPQCYNGAMTEVWDTLAIARDLAAAGFSYRHIRPFYDAAHLPEYWDGYAFTQGRLP